MFKSKKGSKDQETIQSSRNLTQDTNWKSEKTITNCLKDKYNQHSPNHGTSFSTTSLVIVYCYIENSNIQIKLKIFPLRKSLIVILKIIVNHSPIWFVLSTCSVE